MKIIIQFSFLLIFIPPIIRAQEYEDIFESQAELYNTEDIEDTELIELHTKRMEFPLNINSVSREELEELEILSDFQIYSLLDYRNTYGDLLSIHELNLIYGFDKKTVSRLLCFVKINPLTIPKKQKTKSFVKLRVSRYFEKQKGYNNLNGQYYLGSPWFVYSQYRFNSSKLQWNLTAEKDAGEEFFRGSNKKGFDYYSFHLALKNIGIIKQLIVGDFRAEFGQGLGIRQTLSFGKSAEVLAVKQRARGLTPYSSSDENRFMRGVALVLQKKQWMLSCFISSKRIDASITSDSSELYYSSFLLTGLHRTENEIERRKTLKENVAGVNLSYKNNYLRAGITALTYKYGGKSRKEIYPYNLFELHRSESSNFSADFQYLYRNISLFGEAGISSNGGKALIAGSIVDMNRYAQFSLVYRNYRPDYQSVFATSFGQSSKTANEEGLYLGINLLPLSAWRISAYFDSYSFPWLKYRVNSPSQSWDYLLQLSYELHPSFIFYTRLKQKSKMENISKNENGYGVQAIKITQLKVNVKYLLTEYLNMQTCVAYNHYSPEIGIKEKGFLFYHDLNFSLPKFPISIALRYALFNTDSWNTRFYAYERNILHVFSIPAYFDKGSRYYINCNWKFNKTLQLWLRFSQTIYSERFSIGSGLNAINGNKQTEMKAQLMVSF